MRRAADLPNQLRPMWARESSICHFSGQRSIETCFRAPSSRRHWQRRWRDVAVRACREPRRASAGSTASDARARDLDRDRRCRALRRLLLNFRGHAESAWRRGGSATKVRPLVRRACHRVVADLPNQTWCWERVRFAHGACDVIPRFVDRRTEASSRKSATELALERLCSWRNSCRARALDALELRSFASSRSLAAAVRVAVRDGSRRVRRRSCRTRRVRNSRRAFRRS